MIRISLPKAIVYTIILLHVSCSDYNEFVINSLADACPYLSTCTHVAQQEFTLSTSEYRPCCVSCSCSELCHLQGNCCPDVSKNRTQISGSLAKIAENLSRERCIQSAYPFVSGVNGYTSYAMYRAIDTCPEEYPDNSVAQKCTQAVPEAIEQVVFASDEDTIYRNIYCARCNGAISATHWNVTAICNDYKQSHAFQIKPFPTFLRRCTLISILPRSYQNLRKKQCFMPEITVCNTTGLWDIYDEFTKRACETESVVHFTLLLAYKNVFCYYCNRRKDTKVRSDVCEDHSSSIRTPMKSFSAILNPNLYTREMSGDSNSNINGCRYNKIYDPYAKECRELICPPTTAAINGKCEQVLVQIENYVIQFYFEINPIRVTSYILTEGDAMAVLKAVKNHLKAKVELKNCLHCISFGNGVLTPSPKLLLTSDIKTTSTCHLSSLTKTFRHLNETVFVNMTHASLFVNVESNANMDNIHSLSQPSKIRLHDLSLIMCTEGVPITYFDCQKVMISGLDYMMALRKQYIMQTDHYKQYKLGTYNDEELLNLTFEICVDEYFSTIGYDHLSASQLNSTDKYRIGIFLFVSVVGCVSTFVYRLQKPYRKDNHYIIISNIFMSVSMCLLFMLSVVKISNRTTCALVKLAYQVCWIAMITTSSVYIVSILPSLVTRSCSDLAPHSGHKVVISVIHAFISLSTCLSIALLIYSFRSLLQDPVCTGLLLNMADWQNSLVAFIVPMFVAIFSATAAMITFREMREDQDLKNIHKIFLSTILIGLCWAAGILHDVSMIASMDTLFFAFSSVIGVYMFCVFGPFAHIVKKLSSFSARFPTSA